MLTLALPTLLSGEIVATSEISFTARNTFRVSDPAKKVFEALVDEVAKWWDPSHTLSEESKCLSLESTTGAYCYEELEDGRSVHDFEVIYVEKERLDKNVEEP